VGVVGVEVGVVGVGVWGVVGVVEVGVVGVDSWGERGHSGAQDMRSFLCKGICWEDCNIRHLAVVVAEQDKYLIYKHSYMWKDIATTILSLLLILGFAYLIVFVLEGTGLYKPKQYSIIHKHELGAGGLEDAVGVSPI
jgi:hypothetical protein